MTLDYPLEYLERDGCRPKMGHKHRDGVQVRDTGVQERKGEWGRKGL